jgi:hypothetical protein
MSWSNMHQCMVQSPAFLGIRETAGLPVVRRLRAGHIIAVENMVYFLYHTTGQSACAGWGER